MFSGKTTELIRRVRSYCSVCTAQHDFPGLVIALKPAIDDRYSPTDIVSHDGQRLAAQTVGSPREILDRPDQADIVAIDEIHFFDDSIVEVCRTLSERDIHVICCGLDRDMWGDEFPHVQRLSRFAETMVMHGVCRRCGRPADRTQRITPLLGDNLVGGPEAFEPRCAACFSPPASPKPGKAIPGLAE